MKVIEFKSKKTTSLEEFIEEIKKADFMPMVTLGYDDDKNVVIITSGMTWQELGHLRTAFDCHVMRDWLSLL